MCHRHSRNNGIWTHLTHCQINERQKCSNCDLPYDLLPFFFFFSSQHYLATPVSHRDGSWKLASKTETFTISGLSSLGCSPHPLFARNQKKKQPGDTQWLLKLSINSLHPLKQNKTKHQNKAANTSRILILAYSLASPEKVNGRYPSPLTDRQHWRYNQNFLAVGKMFWCISVFSSEEEFYISANVMIWGDAETHWRFVLQTRIYFPD